MSFGLPHAKVSPSLKKLRRRLRAARRWSVMAGLFGGTAAVLLPYQGLGPLDAIWAGLFGGSAVLAAFRWVDYRQLSKALPGDHAQLAVHGTAALALEAHTIANELAGKVRSKRRAVQFRDSAAAPAHRRLESASAALSQLAPQLTGPAREAMDDVRESQHTLQDLADRIRSVEKSMSLASPDRRAGLAESHTRMVNRLESGVTAFEEMVGATATVVAEQAALDGVVGVQDATLLRLRESTTRLHGLAEGIGQMRQFHTERDFG